MAISGKPDWGKMLDDSKNRFPEIATGFALAMTDLGVQVNVYEIFLGQEYFCFAAPISQPLADSFPTGEAKGLS